MFLGKVIQKQSRFLYFEMDTSYLQQNRHATLKAVILNLKTGLHNKHICTSRSGLGRISQYWEVVLKFLGGCY